MPNGNPLTELQFQIQENIATATPESLEAAEGQIRSLAESAPGAAPQALQLQRELLKAREQGRRQREAARILSPEPLAPPTRDVELERIAEVEGPRTLEQFQLPAGTLQPGEREVGRLITTEGTPFARAVVEGPTPPTPERGPLTEDQIIQLSPLVSKGTLDRLIEMRQPKDLNLKGPDITAGQFEDFARAGIDLSGRESLAQVTPAEWKRLGEAEKIETKEAEKAQAAAKREEQLEEDVPLTDLLRMVNPRTLAHPKFDSTRGDIKELQDAGDLVIADRKAIESARELRGNIAPLLRIRRLARQLLTAVPGQNFIQALELSVRQGLATSQDIAIFTSLKGALALGLAANLNRGRPTEKDAERIDRLFPGLADSVKTAVPLVDNLIFFLNSQARAKLGFSALPPEFEEIFKAEQARELKARRERVPEAERLIPKSRFTMDRP